MTEHIRVPVRVFNNTKWGALSFVHSDHEICGYDFRLVKQNYPLLDYPQPEITNPRPPLTTHAGSQQKTKGPANADPLSYIASSASKLRQSSVVVSTSRGAHRSPRSDRAVQHRRPEPGSVQ
jgi:hypothetical protein